MSMATPESRTKPSGAHQAIKLAILSLEPNTQNKQTIHPIMDATNNNHVIVFFIIPSNFV